MTPPAAENGMRFFSTITARMASAPTSTRTLRDGALGDGDANVIKDLAPILTLVFRAVEHDAVAASGREVHSKRRFVGSGDGTHQLHSNDGGRIGPWHFVDGTRCEQRGEKDPIRIHRRGAGVSSSRWPGRP